METEQVVIRNKGVRTYRLPNGPGGIRRELEPSRTLAVSPEEAKQHLNYFDIEDAAKAVPQTAKLIDDLRAENARLQAALKNQNATLAVADPIAAQAAPVVTPPVPVARTPILPEDMDLVAEAERPRPITAKRKGR